MTDQTPRTEADYDSAHFDGRCSWCGSHEVGHRPHCPRPAETYTALDLAQARTEALDAAEPAGLDALAPHDIAFIINCIPWEREDLRAALRARLRDPADYDGDEGR